MAIKTRETVAHATIRRQPRREPVRRPPTQSTLSIAAYALADEMGGRDLPVEERDEAAAKIYNFAAKSVATAWSLVDSAVMAIRCRQGRRKVSGVRDEIVKPFEDALGKAKKADLDRKAEIVEAFKAEDADKDALEAELKELLLRAIPQGRDYKLGEKASTFLVEAMLAEFLPVKGSPLAMEDFPRFVRDNVRFLDWLGASLPLFGDEQITEYAEAKSADKAARATDAAEAAPEADAEELSDEEETEVEEEAQEPVAEATASA